MMKLIVASTVMVILLISTSVDAEGKKHHMKNMTCKGEVMSDMKSMLTSKRECMKELYPDSTTTQSSTATDEEKKEAFMKIWKEIHDNLCFDVCVWKKQKFINDDGTYNSDELAKFVEAHFPSSVQADLKTAFTACATDNSSKFSMDNKCEGYKAFRDCKTKKFMEICEIKMGKQQEE